MAGDYWICILTRDLCHLFRRDTLFMRYRNNVIRPVALGLYNTSCELKLVEYVCGVVVALRRHRGLESRCLRGAGADL